MISLLGSRRPHTASSKETLCGERIVKGAAERT